MQTLKSFPNFELAHIAFGNLCLDQGRYEEAVVALKQALQIAPHIKRIHFLLGNAYEGQNMKEEAEHEYKLFKKKD